MFHSRCKKRQSPTAQGIGGVRSRHAEGEAGAKRSPGKPGFRREALEMRPNFFKNLRNV
jgi:hypothetical protein